MSQDDLLRSESVTKAPLLSTLRERRARERGATRQSGHLGLVTEGDQLWEEEAGIAELDEAKVYVSLILPHPETSFCRERGELSVMAGFLARFVMTLDSWLGTDKGAMAGPGGPYEQKSKLHSVASRAPLVEKIIWSVDLGKRNTRKGHINVRRDREGAPVVASIRRNSAPDGVSGPSVRIATTTEALAEPFVTVRSPATLVFRASF